ncbi:MAG: GNAT family N-acetyltransferase [Aliiglaciecola sp.]|uniref:GNAT family N-acetyltransferase n=1 Tax=Aliiglaciecola sp. M165 TaxID=2593649 RepID=UPI0011811509|nr:GNAT family N-acetyltransferase [Aliiglaciecola sp. M165]TRY31018.1 GNAT family N-acetyltransferase [Aliiglaciecola sp. M165]
MKIRRAVINDVSDLVDFNQAMAQETESKALDQQTLSKGVSALITDPNKGFYLVAQQADGQIIGSLMVTFEWSDWRNAQFWWIQSVYVRPQNRRTGVYSKLYQQVQALAEQNDGVCGYRLYVEKDNLPAQKTYESLGMHESYYLMYESKL